MGLKLKQPGIQPAGQFDGYDSEVTTVKGGEVGTIIGVTVGTDLAAYDTDGSDGYVGVPPGTRPCITVTLASGARPLGLVDDGNSPDYGTLFGSVVGGTAGQLTNGAIIGPHSATGSGKLTFWMKPGTYAVTLDAVDVDPTTGLVPSNPTISIGDALYATTAGLLTPDDSVAFEDVVLARFINFETNGSLVTTPVSLVSAANSPVGLPENGQQDLFTEAVIEFAPPIA